MTTIKYEVIGSPVKVYANCDDISVTICWIGRTIYDDECNDKYMDERICSAITITPGNTDISGETTWNGNTIEYFIYRNCPVPPEPSCAVGCSELSVYPTPKYVTDDESIEIHYQYYLTCESWTCQDCGYSAATEFTKCPICESENILDYVGSRVRKSGVDVKSISDTEFFVCDEDGKCVGEYKIDDYSGSCSGDVVVFKTEPTSCKTNCRTDVSIAFSKNEVSYSGEDINVIVSFKKTMTDEECHRAIKTGSFMFPWEISACTKQNDEDFHCCEDHYVTSSITISDLINKGKLDGCTIYYNGKLVTDKIDYYVLQKAKFTDECEHYCEQETTYCVDSGSVKVCYETSYYSEKWICDGESADTCDCDSLILEDSITSVPFTGGRIKVKWNYTGETTTPNCSTYTTSGTWEEKILIGACDERPIDCKDEYKGTDGHSETCNICDAQCCYNYDGNGSCRCVIYFKKRTPTCNTCEASPPYYYFPSIDDSALFDDEEEAIDYALSALTEQYPDVQHTEEEARSLMKEMTFNVIRYEFKQDCTPTCDYIKTYRYDKKEYTIECEPSYTEKTYDNLTYTAVTEYIGTGCPPPVEMEMVTAFTITNITPNKTPGERVFLDNDIIKVTQQSCWTPPTECGCDDFVLEDTCDCSNLILEGETQCDCNDLILGDSDCDKLQLRLIQQ